MMRNLIFDLENGGSTYTRVNTVFDIFLNRLSKNSAVFPVISHKLFSEVPL